MTQPDFTSPIAGRVEVREPCPFCPDRPMISRALMDEHVAEQHPEVQTAEAAGVAPATDQTGLRDRIAEAVYPTYGQEDRNRSLAIADAVLAVLPASTGQTHPAAEPQLPNHTVNEDEAPDADPAVFTAADLVSALRGAGAERDKLDRAAVLREAIDVAREEGHRLEAEEGIDAARGARSVAYLLRKLLAKAQPAAGVGAAAEPADETGEALARFVAEHQRELVHGCPPDGSGLTPCCGRTPFELPRGDRISSEAPVTCPGPAAGRQTKQEQQ